MLQTSLFSLLNRWFVILLFIKNIQTSMKVREKKNIHPYDQLLEIGRLPNDDKYDYPERRIFLSHPHINKGFFFLSHH